MEQKAQRLPMPAAKPRRISNYRILFSFPTPLHTKIKFGLTLGGILHLWHVGGKPGSRAGRAGRCDSTAATALRRKSAQMTVRWGNICLSQPIPNVWDAQRLD